MTLAAKLLGFFNRAFDTDPGAFLALRLRYDGTMVWRVAAGRLTTAVSGGSGAALSVDLGLYTMQQLGGWLALQPGYSVPYVSAGEEGAASALRLVEGQGAPAESNGDHLLGYTSILYAWIAAQAQELALAKKAIVAIPEEMSTTTAHGGWLDYQGSFYRVARLPGETDQSYGTRIITEVLRPAGNNVALEAAIHAYTGQYVSISDVVIYRAPEPSFGGIARFNGYFHFQQQQQPVYGLLDLVVGYDLLGGLPPAKFAPAIRQVIEKLRDAGTQLRNLSLRGGELSDPAFLPTDADDSLVINRTVQWNGVRRFNGAVTFAGPTAESGSMSGVGSTVTSLSNGIPLAVRSDGAIGTLSVRGSDGVLYDVRIGFDPLAV